MTIRCIPGGIFLTNCYIIGDEDTKEAILIDPGEQLPEILQDIKESNLSITKIVNPTARFVVRSLNCNLLL